MTAFAMTEVTSAALPGQPDLAQLVSQLCAQSDSSIIQLVDHDDAGDAIAGLFVVRDEPMCSALLDACALHGGVDTSPGLTRHTPQADLRERANQLLPKALIGFIHDLPGDTVIACTAGFAATRAMQRMVQHLSAY